MFRPQQLVPNPDLPPASPKMFSCADLCGLCISAFSSLSCFTLSFFRNKREEINPLYSTPSALFKNEYFDKSFPINSFRTLLQNTGGGTPPPEILAFFSGVLASAHSPSATKSRRTRTYEKNREGEAPRPANTSPRQKPGCNIQVLPLLPFHLGNAHT